MGQSVSLAFGVTMISANRNVRGFNPQSIKACRNMQNYNILLAGYQYKYKISFIV